MPFSIIFFILVLFENSNSQWYTAQPLLNNDQKFTEITGSTAYQYAGNFLLPQSETTAKFITCTTPLTSYITLNSTYPITESYNFMNQKNGDYVSIDLFFHGTWQSEIVQFNFTIGSFSSSYTYIPSSIQQTTGFCNSTPFEVRTWNFSIQSSQGKMQLQSINTNYRQVSIKNIIVSSLNIICYPSCNTCTGPQFNQCTSCYYGQPTNNICPICPSNQFYAKQKGCKDICDLSEALYSNGFCQNFPTYTIEEVYITLPISNPQNLKWYMIYDQQHLDTSPTSIVNSYPYIYGVFQFTSGIYRYFNRLPTYSNSTLLIGLKISIVTYNDIPIDCGIQFKINNTYYGSIYRNGSGIQTHKLKIYQKTPLNSYLNYASNVQYDLIIYVDIPKYQFLFSAIGNYTVNTAGWGMQSIKITSGYCPPNCQLCEVSFKCKTCQSGFYLYRDGSCIQYCYFSTQKNISGYCQDLDDETPYSQYLIQEYVNLATDPGQYAQYTLLSETGTNFLKGSDIYYSYFQGIRIFGGPFVWAQAKFQRIHNIMSPHHSVTIVFTIVYGPYFPSNGKFIYTIESDVSVSKQTSNYLLTYFDGSKQDTIYEKINHNNNILNITWECFGSNNEPVKAYCGFYNYYIAVHYCQPYCLQCSDQSTCTTWNTTYDRYIVKFSQAECLTNQYYDKDSLRCLDCPYSCLTCTSNIDCQTCKSTYIQTKLGCICQMNQYEEQNQCFDCPIECNQCLSFTYCIECLITNNRQLSNGQCNCIDGYYQIVSNPQCKQCHQFCKTCIGPTSAECLSCNNIENIEQVGSTCRCPTGLSFQDVTQSCSSCHSSCLTCFITTIDGCLSCNPILNRILKGLKCVCEPGYYELINNCRSICNNHIIDCPITEDASLSQCYKLCNNNQLIWHTITCNSCDTGLQLVSGECQPICGDLLILGNEQCEDNNTILNDLCYNCQFQCPVHCLTCDQSTTLPCPDVCGDGIISGSEECEDGNTIEYDGCFNCKYSCQPQCTKCVKGECFECFTEGWQIDPTVSPWQCKERCGDGLIIGSEQCEDGNINDTDGCKDCKYFCGIGCSSCDFTTNTCLSCQLPGFIPYSYYCKNLCGDGLVVADNLGNFIEQCDDGNTIDFDGCSSSCQFQCQQQSICTTCKFNRCETCANGYQLSNQKICVPICGDQFVLAGEQCEVSSVLPYKGCQNCQAKCQISCLTCDTTGLGCTQCKDGYDKIENLCYSICGDHIITEDEQCDDGNLIIGDGCHFCQYSCQDSCLICLKGICYDCQVGYQLIQSQCYSICGDGLQQQNEQCEIITSLQTYQSCQFCQFICDLNCYFCQFGICQQCKDGYDLSLNQQDCIESLIPNVIIIENCQIQIGNSCVQCEDHATTKTCINDYNMNKCPNNCKLCLFSKCLECEFGYYGNKCVPKCGDGIIVQEEECDDGSKYQLDNCLNCKYQCPQYCQTCAYGDCTYCFIGFYLDIVSNTCNSVCGDNILADDEVCDDGNELKYDGCFQCKYQCQMECLDCQFGKCVLCYSPLILAQSKGICVQQKQCLSLMGLYYDTYSNDCLPQCGDSIVAGNELCEDGNNIPYDGCYQCQYQCHEMCTKCQKGQCFECYQGYYLYGQQCLTKCGDGIKIGDELCDDQNYIERDGCTFCQIDPFYKCEEDINLLSLCYRCQDNCEDCILNIDIIECKRCKSGYFLKHNTCNACSDKCEECINTPNNCTVCSTDGCKKCYNISGFYLDKQLKSCVTKCGDNIIAGNEQCDDGNRIDKDGCNSKCEIEKEFICKGNICYIPPQKQISLMYSNSTTTNDLELIFEDLKIDDICEKLKIRIELFKSHEFKYEIKRKDTQNQSGQVICEIKFNFFKTIVKSNLIHLIVPLKNNLTRLLEEETREIVIAPRRFTYYNQEQKSQAQNVVTVSSTFIFLLQLIGPLTILFGGFDFFWTILDIMTWINNFYFINVDYPLNVKLFFKKFEWGDIFNIPNIITLNSTEDPYYFEAPPKFTEKDVNPLFLNNIQLFCEFILSAILGYIISICIMSIIQIRYKSNRVITNKMKIFSVIEINKSVETKIPQTSKSKVMPYFINFLYLELLWFKENFRAKLLQIIGLVFLDICLACALQLKYTINSEYAIIKLNIILAIVGVIFIFIVFQIYSFVCSQHQILYETQKFKNYYSSLYEGINTKQLLGRNYCYVNLIRKTCFIFFTVYFYEVPLLQTAFCCLTCFLNLALIFYQNPFENRRLLIYSLINDFCIFLIICITVLLAIDDVSNIFSFDEKYFIGWIILFFVGFSIIVQLIFLVQQFCLGIKLRITNLKDFFWLQPSQKN